MTILKGVNHFSFQRIVFHVEAKMLISKMYSQAISDLIAKTEASLIADGLIGQFYKYVNNKLNGSNGIAPL